MRKQGNEETVRLLVRTGGQCSCAAPEHSNMTDRVSITCKMALTPARIIHSDTASSLHRLSS